jgi:hypothetical protein
MHCFNVVPRRSLSKVQPLIGISIPTLLLKDWPNAQSVMLDFETDIQADPRRAFKRVVDFLELNPSAPGVTLHRVNQRSGEDLIESWEEVCRALIQYDL